MKNVMVIIGIIILCLSVVTPVLAAGNEEQKVEQAAEVLEEIMEITDAGGIPVSLLEDAHGVMVIPDVLKVGYILGGRHGKGILVTKTESDSWSNPVFVELKAGSIGWQIGVQSTDLVLLFDSEESIEKILDSEFTLGADASVAAGPAGRGIGAQTDVGFESEIYSYSKSKGLFAGVSLEGASLQVDYNSTESYYGDIYTSVRQILSGEQPEAPESAAEFLNVLEYYIHN